MPAIVLLRLRLMRAQILWRCAIGVVVLHYALGLVFAQSPWLDLLASLLCAILYLLFE